MIFTYLDQKQLKNLKNYKYTGTSRSYIDKYILGPFWNWIVEYLPLWLAPNLVTLTGLLTFATSSIAIVYHAPTFQEEVPSWIWVWAGISLFIYQTMDAIDGKQARRTGSASPLGQLFDHGCDAIATLFVAINGGAAFGAGPHFTVCMLLLGAFPFFVNNWEEFHTGQMRFGEIGVTEAELVFIGVFFTTAAFGSELWVANVPYVNMELRYALIIGSFVLGSSSLVESSLLVLESVRNKTACIQAAVLQCVQFFSFLLMSLAYVYSPNSPVDQYPLLTFFSIGFSFTYLVSRLIISHVSHSDYALFHTILWPLPVVTANAWSPFIEFASHEEIQFAYFAFVLVLYSYFVVKVIDEICSYLGISAFVITTKSKKLQ